jgi:hypothetical protein
MRLAWAKGRGALRSRSGIADKVRFPGEFPMKINLRKSLVMICLAAGSLLAGTREASACHRVRCATTCYETTYVTPTCTTDQTVYTYPSCYTYQPVYTYPTCHRYPRFFRARAWYGYSGCYGY